MTPTTASTGKLLETTLPERLDKAQRELAARRAQLDRGTTITAIVGVILLLLLAGYFTFGYFEIKKLTDADKLVNFAGVQVDSVLPEVRATVEKQITTQAPDWATTMSRQLLASLPDVRKQLESTLEEHLTAGMKEAEAKTKQEFEAFLTKNRPLIDAKIKELADHPKLADKSIKELEDAMEQAYESDMKAQAQQTYRGLRSFVQRLQRISNNIKLTPAEAQERKVLMLVKRLQLEKEDPDLVTDAINDLPPPDAPPPAKPAVKAPKAAPVKKKAKEAPKPAAKE